ncbi:hypothetical protein SHKM778_12810 [Streptomyces sp. KM77-8]|uniref:Uncharacterized protein n=1 Tax=Streptomyces haneummycinicus TaxID=3074435 RepID=A0AAT9HC60_9ACTN
MDRLTPGRAPERQLERQLDLLRRESETLAAALRDKESRRQESHTRYPEERGGAGRTGSAPDADRGAGRPETWARARRRFLRRGGRRKWRRAP